MLVFADTGHSSADAPRLTHRRVLGGAVWTLGCSGLTLLSLTTAGILLARMLGTTGRAEVAAAILVPSIVAYAGWLGLPVATGYWIITRPELRSTILATARTLAVALSLILGAIGLVVTAFFPVHESVRSVGMLFVPFIPLILFSSLQLAVLQAELRTRAFNLIQLAGSAAYPVILLGLDRFGRVTVTNAVLTQLTAVGIWFILSSFLTSSRPSFGYDREAARSLLGYGLRSHFGSISPVDAFRIDQLILALFLPPYNLGLYVIAMTVVTANRAIGASLGKVAFPIAAHQATDEGGRSVTVLRTIFAATALLSSFAAVVEILLGRWLLRVLFDVDDDAAYSVLIVLVIGSVFMNLRQVSSDILRGLGRPGIPSLSELVSLPTICGLAVVFWDHGLIGVAWAVTLSAGIGLLVVLSVGFVSSFGPTGRRERYSTRNGAGGMLKRIFPQLLGCVAVGAAGTAGAGLVQVSPRESIALVAMATILVGAALILARWGSRGLSALALYAAALTLGMNGIRVSTSVTLGDLFLLAAALTLLPAIIFQVGQQQLATVKPFLRGTALIIAGGTAGSFFASDPIESFSQLFRFSVAAMLVPVVFALWSPSVLEIRRVTWLWVFSVSLSSLVAVTERGEFLQGRADGLTNHPNHLALSCVMAIGPAVALTLLERGTMRWFGAACSSAMGLGLLISGSRAGILAWAITIVVLAVVLQRAAVVAGIIAAGVASAVVLGSGVIPFTSGNALTRLFGSEDQAVSQAIVDSNTGRQQALIATINQILHNPWTGVGFQDALYAHNIFLQVLASAGILGLVGFLMIITSVVNISLKSFSARVPIADPVAMLLLIGFSAGYAGYIANGIFSNALWDRYIWLTPGMVAVLTPHAIGYVPKIRTQSKSKTLASQATQREAPAALHPVHHEAL